MHDSTQRIPKASVSALADLDDVVVPVAPDRPTIAEIARRVRAQLERSAGVAPWLERVLEHKRQAVFRSGHHGQEAERLLWSWLERRVGELEATVYLGPLFEEERDSRPLREGLPTSPALLVERVSSPRTSILDRWSWEELVRIPAAAVALYCVEGVLLSRLTTVFADTPLCRVPVSLWLERLEFRRGSSAEERAQAALLRVAATFLVRERREDSAGVRGLGRLLSLPDPRKYRAQDWERCRRMLLRTPGSWSLRGETVEQARAVMQALFGVRSILKREAAEVSRLYSAIIKIVGDLDSSLVPDELRGPLPREGNEAAAQNLRSLARYLPSPTAGEPTLLARLRRAIARAGGENVPVFTLAQGSSHAAPARRRREKRVCQN